MSPEISRARNDGNKSSPAGGSCRIDRNNVGTVHMIVILLSCAQLTNLRASITTLRSAIHTRAPHSKGTSSSLSEKSKDNGAVLLKTSVPCTANSLTCQFRY